MIISRTLVILKNAIIKLLDIYFIKHPNLKLILVKAIEGKPIHRPSTMLLIVEEVYKYHEKSIVEVLGIPFRFNTYLYINGCIWEYSKWGKYH